MIHPRTSYFTLSGISLFFLALLTYLTELFPSTLSPFNNLTANLFNIASLVPTAKVLSIIGESHVLIPILAGIVFILLLSRRNTHALNIFLVSLATVITVISLKVLTAVARPEGALIPTPDTLSFPSAHASFSLLLALVIVNLAYTYMKKRAFSLSLSIIATLCALAIGLSRIVLGVHMGTEVLAGFLVTFFWFSLFAGLRRN